MADLDARPAPDAAGHAVTLRLRYRPPFDWLALLAHLAARSLAGVDEVTEVSARGRYRRTVAIGGASGTVDVAHEPRRHELSVTVELDGAAELADIVARVRRIFDLEADVEAIGVHLAADPLLAPLVRRRPGLRVPGAWDGFELAVRAVLGQQVTVAAARRLGSRLVTLCGTPLPAVAARPQLTHAFPTPERLANADLSLLGMPARRRATLTALAAATAADPGIFADGADPAVAAASLLAVPGIGAWTVAYVALRAWREPDAFPASDVALLRTASRLAASRWSAADLLQHAEHWRPWRAYAAQHLWTADGSETAEISSPTDLAGERE